MTPNDKTEKIHNVFFKMERCEKLFNEVDSFGFNYWDIIRREVFINISSNLHNKPSSYIEDKRGFIQTSILNFFKKIKNEFLLSYIIARKPKYLFLLFRRDYNASKRIDIISNDLYNCLKAKSVAIDYIQFGKISYLQNIFKEKIIPRISILKNQYIVDKSIISKINKCVLDYFGIQLDFGDIIQQTLEEFYQTNIFYNKLFFRSEIEYVIGSNDGSLKGLYHSAKRNKVKIIEMQHGISPGSIMWTYDHTYTEILGKSYLPDTLFTFSEFWNDKIKYPIKSFFSLGNNYFSFSEVDGTEDIMVISNKANSSILLELAIQLSKGFLDRIIYFKLHPQEFNLESRIKKSLKSYPNIRVLTNEYDYFQLLSLFTHLIGIRSTLMYIGLQARKRVYMYKTHNFDWDDVACEFVQYFDQYEELKKIIENNSEQPLHKNVPVFFEKFEAETILNYFG